MATSGTPFKFTPGLPLAVVLLALGILAGCGSTPMTRGLAEVPPPGLPSRVELAAVPFYPQELYQCGPASLAGVLGYRGINVSPEELRSEVYVPAREGSFQAEMIAAARSRGLVVYPLEPSLENLLREIAAGHPVVVLQNLSLRWYPLWHYAVVIGYDLSRQELVLRSGTTERLVTDFSVFERTWARSDHWAVLVMSPEQMPVTAEPLKYLQAAQDLESLGHIEEARQAYRTALQRWPDHPVALMGAGNTAYAMEDYSASVEAFLALTEKDPNLAAGWNNLAYALVADGCEKEAVEAAQCAVQLAPDDANVVSSLIEILRLSAIKSEEKICASLQCPEPSL